MLNSNSHYNTENQIFFKKTKNFSFLFIFIKFFWLPHCQLFNDCLYALYFFALCQYKRWKNFNAHLAKDSSTNTSFSKWKSYVVSSLHVFCASYNIPYQHKCISYYPITPITSIPEIYIFPWSLLLRVRKGWQWLDEFVLWHAGGPPNSFEKVFYPLIFKQKID